MPAKVSTTIIDPDGDVTLELGENEGKNKLLVSSKVLSLASPVFARMFKSQFREGLANKNAASGNPHTVHLPEDDADAFNFLCHILHFRKSDSAPKLTMTLLSNVATISHKWDFTAALAPFVERWLQIVGWLSTSCINKLLAVAYILDVPHAFQRISYRIIREQIGPIISLPGLSDNELIPETLIKELEWTRTTSHLAMMDEIDNLISKISQCSTFHVNAYSFFTGLQARNIWPLGQVLKTRSISDVWSEMLHYQPGPSWVTCGSRGCICDLTDFRSVIWGIRSASINKVRTLCLDCLKGNSKSGHSADCRSSEETNFFNRRREASPLITSLDNIT